jgi:hypothetical protein
MMTGYTSHRVPESMKHKLITRPIYGIVDVEDVE